VIDQVFVCPEKRGQRIRRVTEVKPSFDIEDYLAKHVPAEVSPMKNLSSIWSYGVRIFLVDDVGVMFKGPLEYQGLPDVHVVFWDRILRGRESMCRHVAQQVAEEAEVRGVCTAMPQEALAVLAFAKRIGFQEVYRGRSIVMLTLLFT